MQNVKNKQWILEELQSKKQRITPLRKKIATVLSSYHGLFSAKEIMKQLPDADRVTVYRTLDTLESLDIIHEVLSHHGEKHYELHGKDHHHHVMCRGCEKANCIDCEITRTKATGFNNIHHSVAFTGLCNACAA